MPRRESAVAANRESGRHGSALLAVLWLVAALTAIALSVAGTVRGEIDRTATTVDGTRAYYLATGGIERAVLYMMWGARYRDTDGWSRYYSAGTRFMRFSFDSGEAVVEIVPETSKLNPNYASREELLRLLMGLGLDLDRADELAAGIVDWRTGPDDGRITEFDRYYLSLTPSFRSSHASFQETEELLLVKGMTPELYHGRMERDENGRLVTRLGVKDCLSVDAGVVVDANAAPAPVLAAIGLGDDEIAQLMEARLSQPLRSLDQLRVIGIGDGVRARLTVGAAPMYMLRSTARLRLPGGGFSDLSRSVGALVRAGAVENGTPYSVYRWYDHL
jgi:general secretion pathway protein K